MIIYGKRMQIEQEFRDVKNTRNGFGLRHCRSFKVERLNVALLIAALATLILWLFGTAAKQEKLHYSFQANTLKNRAVLSVFIVGWQVLMRPIIYFSKKQLIAALELVATLTANGENYVR